MKKIKYPHGWHWIAARGSPVTRHFNLNVDRRHPRRWIRSIVGSDLSGLDDPWHGLIGTWLRERPRKSCLIVPKKKKKQEEKRIERNERRRITNTPELLLLVSTGQTALSLHPIEFQQDAIYTFFFFVLLSTSFLYSLQRKRGGKKANQHHVRIPVFFFFMSAQCCSAMFKQSSMWICNSRKCQWPKTTQKKKGEKKIGTWKELCVKRVTNNMS